MLQEQEPSDGASAHAVRTLEEAAAEYTRRTGEPMNANTLYGIEQRALIKLWYALHEMARGER